MLHPCSACESGAPLNQPRDEFGRFPPGVSGNPKGRPKKHPAVADVLSATESGQIIRSLLQKACEGDAGAARLLLDRIEPAVKVHELSVESVRGYVERVLDRLMPLIPEDRREEAFHLLEDARDGSSADAPLDLH